MSEPVMENVALWLIAVFVIGIFLNWRWIEHDRATMRFTPRMKRLRLLITATRHVISSSPSGSATMLETDVARAEVSCELSCLPQHLACLEHLACRAPSLACDLSRLSRLPQELVKEGGTLHKQHNYEVTSWTYCLVDWWLRGPLAVKSVALAIAALEKSVEQFSQAT